MRKATVAKLSLTALVGICSFVGSANLASATPGPLKAGPAGPTTTTTMKPLIAEPADYCDTHICLEAEPYQPPMEKPGDKAAPKGGSIVTPQADEGCPSTDPTCPPPGDECPLGKVCPPDDDCTPIPGAADCPKEDPCRPGNDGPSAAFDDCDDCDDGPHIPRVNDESGKDDWPDPCDPCRPGRPDDEPHAARSFDECNPCDDGPIIARHGGDEDDPCRPEDDCEGHDRPTDDGPTRSHIDRCDPCIELPPGDGPTRHGDTGGGDDCGGTGGHDGRLPKTGGDIVTLAGMGLGLTGIGAAAKRLGRRSKQEQGQE